MRLSGLADVLRGAGLTVIEMDGWEDRGFALQKVDAVVCHGTITPASTPDANVAKILRDGHATLKGPLCQLGLDRQGRWWVVASGKGNHNGYGEYGNQTVGIEAFHDGKEPWPEVQLASWKTGCAALCKHLRLPADRVFGHKETDPSRKVDPAYLNMAAFRRSVAQLMEVDMTPEQEKWLGRVHHFVEIEWPEERKKIDQIHQHLEVLMKGATLGNGVVIPPVPRVIFDLAEKHGIDV